MNDQPAILIESGGPSMKLIALNQPEKRNALSIALMDQLHDAGAQRQHTPSAGSSFCAATVLYSAPGSI